jgi:hypothetical protein
MTMNDAELAVHLAQVAGRLLLEVRASGMLSLKALGKAGDATANQFLCHALREQRPDDGLLSEEEKDSAERLSKSRVWIIDPVDGTREYGEARTDWAVHVGLAIDGVASVGAVGLPGLGVVLRTDAPVAVPAAPERLRPRWPKNWGPNWCRWAAPGPRPWPSCAARRTFIFIPAGSTNGIRAHPQPWRWPMACMPRASMVRRWFTIRRMFTCPIC